MNAFLHITNALISAPPLTPPYRHYHYQNQHYFLHHHHRQRTSTCCRTPSWSCRRASARTTTKSCQSARTPLMTRSRRPTASMPSCTTLVCALTIITSKLSPLHVVTLIVISWCGCLKAPLGTLRSLLVIHAHRSPLE